MTDAQIFQLIGIAYLVIGIGLFTSREYYKKIVAGFTESPAALYIGGLAALFIGFLLVTFHNDWVKGWPVIITIIGWISLAKGILILAMPQLSMKISNNMMRSTNFFKVWPIAVIIIGVLCCWLGFFVLQKPII